MGTDIHKCVHIEYHNLITYETEEDKKLLEQRKEDMNKLMEMIIQASKIPSKYFDSNPDEK